MSQQEDETKRRARNRFYLLVATIVFVLANVISITAYVLNTNYARTHMAGHKASSARP